MTGGGSSKGWNLSRAERERLFLGRGFFGAVRGGFGLYYDQISTYYYLPVVQSNPPMALTRTLAQASLANTPFPTAYAAIRSGQFVAPEGQDWLEATAERVAQNPLNYSLALAAE